MSFGDVRSRIGRLLTNAPAPLVFNDSVATWADAQKQSSGYAEAEILKRVVAATTAVRRGDAVFERDGVQFQHQEYRWPIAYALAKAAAHDGSLHVLDIGGSLGSTYWQHRPLLADFDVQWTVLEQPAFAEVGRALCGDELTFVTTLNEVKQLHPWSVVLLSSVLQYLEYPWDVLRDVQQMNADTIIIDRTPMHNGPNDIVTVQHVPEHIYPAAYPCWILSKQRVTAQLRGWNIVAEVPGIEPAMKITSGIPFEWSGYIATRDSP